MTQKQAQNQQRLDIEEGKEDVCGYQMLTEEEEADAEGIPDAVKPTVRKGIGKQVEYVTQ